jgi:hypothetical protein
VRQNREAGPWLAVSRKAAPVDAELVYGLCTGGWCCIGIDSIDCAVVHVDSAVYMFVQRAQGGGLVCFFVFAGCQAACVCSFWLCVCVSGAGRRAIVLLFPSHRLTLAVQYSTLVGWISGSDIFFLGCCCFAWEEFEAVL